MRLLHFRRTFVEKLFAIHGKVEAFRRGGRPVGTYARHHYDLYCLAVRPEVAAMLRSPEYGLIKSDYDRVSRVHFGRDYLPPPGMGFADSAALFPPADLRPALAAEFERQCRLLCFGPYPTWAEVEGRFETLRPFL